jgi:predicted RNase H-like nuclease (RuvC/YqgF family)
MSLGAAEIAAYGALLGVVGALARDTYRVWHSRKTEKAAIEEALDRQPLVRQQLELGNVGEAVRHQSAIIDSQATHIKGQDSRIQGLEQREKALEAEAAGWESRYRGLESQMTEMRRRLDDCERRGGVDPQD